MNIKELNYEWLEMIHKKDIKDRTYLRYKGIIDIYINPRIGFCNIRGKYIKAIMTVKATPHSIARPPVLKLRNDAQSASPRMQEPRRAPIIDVGTPIKTNQ